MFHHRHKPCSYLGVTWWRTGILVTDLKRLRAEVAVLKAKQELSLLLQSLGSTAREQEASMAPDDDLLQVAAMPTHLPFIILASCAVCTCDGCS